MFNKDYLVEVGSLTKTHSSFGTTMRRSVREQEGTQNNPMRLVRRSLQLGNMLTERSKLWSTLKNSTNMKQSQLLRERARSLIQLPKNPETLRKGFSPFVDINLTNKTELKQVITRLPQDRPLSKSNNTARGLLRLEMKYNQMQYQQISQHCNEQFAQTLENFRSLYKKRLSSLDADKHVRVYQKISKEIEELGVIVKLLCDEEVEEMNKFGWRPLVPEDAVVVRDRDKVYFFGGRGKTKGLPLYQINTRKWEEEPALKDMYIVTGTTLLEYKDRFLMFGGEVPVEHARSKTLTSKIFEINFQKGFMKEIGQSESPQKVQVTTIAGRRCQGSCIYGDFLLVFGGINQNYKHLNELYSYSIKENQWEMIPYQCKQDINQYLSLGIAKFKMLSIFHPRSQYQLYQNPEIKQSNKRKIKLQGVYLFGGLNQNGNSLKKLLILTLGSYDITLNEPKTKGKAPSARCDYSMCLWPEHQKLIIHGGRDDSQSPHILSDLHLLDLLKMQWLRVDISEQVSRTGHQLVTEKDAIWIFGGKDLKGITKQLVRYVVQW